MNCPRCNYENKNDALFCEKCGYKLQSSSQQIKPAGVPVKPEQKSINASSNTTSKTIIIILIVLVLIFAILAAVGAAIYIHKKNADAETYYSDESATDYFEEDSTTEVWDDEEEESTTRKPATTKKKTTKASSNGLSRNKQYEINIFLSNFAEVDFDDFDINGSNDEQIIDFSMLHNYANNFGGIKYSSSDDLVTLSAATVRKNAKRFFNTSVYCTSTNLVNYDSYEEKFYAYASDLSNHNFYANLGFNKHYEMAVVDKMSKNGDGTHDVEFTVYSSDNSISDNYYYYHPGDAQRDSNFAEIYSGSATVRDYYVDGTNKYQLIYYSTNK